MKHSSSKRGPYSSKKRGNTKLTIFVVILVIFLFTLLIGPLGLLGPELSKAVSTQVGALFTSDLGGYMLTVPKIFAAIAALAVTYLICAALNFLIELLARTDRARTIKTLTTSIIRYMGVILGLIWALSILGMNPTAVFASLGIAALIVGFGAQSLIEDVISGLFIVFENQYNVGDIIVLDDFRGSVVRIGVRTTTIVDAGGNYKIVNNSEIRNLQNRSQAPSVAVCDIGITYEEDVRRVEGIMEAAFPTMYENNKSVFEAPPYYLGVESIADSAIVLRYAVRCKEVNVFAARRRLNRELRIAFADHNIEIPFNQLDVHSR